MSSRLQSKAALAVCVALAGCTPAYVVTLLEPPADPAAYAKDFARCTADTAKFKPTFDFGAVGFGAVSGASKAATGAVVGGPLVAAVGAAGGASDAASQGLDILGQAQQNVFRHCMETLTGRDGAALIADPN